MSDFETIDAVELSDVTGGIGNPFRVLAPVARGAVKAYEAAKPYAKKAWDALNVVGTVGAGVDAAYEGYKWLTGGNKQPEQPKQGGQ